MSKQSNFSKVKCNVSFQVFFRLKTTSTRLHLLQPKKHYYFFNIMHIKLKLPSENSFCLLCKQGLNSTDGVCKKFQYAVVTEE